MRSPSHMGAFAKTALGLGVVTGIGAALYFLFKRSGGLVPSLPSEWALPSFTTTNDFLNVAPPPPGLVPCSCPAGSTPTRRPDGSCSCPEVGIEVGPAYGTKCRSDSQCGVGICINGECAPESEWS